VSHWFACEIRELVRLRGENSPSVRRVDRGFARTEGSERSGFHVEASSEPFDETLHRLVPMLRLPAEPSVAHLPPDVSVRVLTRASAVSGANGLSSRCEQVIALAAGNLSMLTTPASLDVDLAALLALAAREPVERVDPSTLPLAWQNGSGAVLLHEVIGHPSERGRFGSTIPSWLRVEDVPADGIVRIEVDDTGEPVSTRTLSDGFKPAALRRWSHRDVPARRMTNLVARGSGQCLTTLPKVRIDALLVAEGYWDPPTDAVRVHVVAADLVDGGHRRPIEPFVYATRREEALRLLSGWFGEVTRHPGVLCGDEGVPLPVGSSAVGLLTEAP
jgi:hypothetical protein